MRAAALGALLALVAACGPHYFVWRDARPSATGFIAARRDPDGAVVAVRPEQLSEQGARDDGARYVGRRLTRPNRFVVGLCLVAIGLPLVGVSLGFGLSALGQATRDGDINRDIAIGFGALGGASTATGIALLSWAWPPQPAGEPIAAHPELVDAPPPLESPTPLHP